MNEAFFYLFSASALICGALVVANPVSRNPVTSAMFLVLSIVSLAGLFVLLHAYFLAAIQILVYAGAVIVLFLFVIMLLDIREETKRPLGFMSLGLAGVTAIATGGILLALISRSNQATGVRPELEGSTAALGRALFADNVLPFEIIGVLLLVAMVGVILLSKKELR